MPDIRPHFACAVSMLIMSAIAVCGCNSSNKNATSGGKKSFKLAFVSSDNSDFWKLAEAGCNDAVRELDNVTVDFRSPKSADVAQQQQIISDLVAAGVDGIAVNPLDPVQQSDALKKVAAKTLLVCHTSDAPASKRV